jgi:hypothetical protein
MRSDNVKDLLTATEMVASGPEEALTSQGYTGKMRLCELKVVCTQLA